MNKKAVMIVAALIFGAFTFGRSSVPSTQVQDTNKKVAPVITKQVSPPTTNSADIKAVAGAATQSAVATPSSTQNTQAIPPSQPTTSQKDSYTNSSGNQVPSPVQSDTAPAGATAKCNDGTYSFSQHRSGTCSHHGGVAEWL